MDAEGNSIEQESEASGIDESFTFQDEFQYIRMLDHLDGTYTAIITIPKGSSTDVTGSLTSFASCLQGENPSATIEAKPNGGFVYNGSNKAWDGGGKFDPIEDLILVTGAENDLREIFSIIDLWFNSGPQIEIQAEVFETRRTDSFERGVSELAGVDIFADEDGQTFLRAIGGSFPTPTSGGTFEMGMLDSSFQISAALKLLEKEGWVDILSRPRIVTRNGVAASVQNTENIPFLEVAGITANNVTYKVNKNEIGITMNVTPFLVGADTIHLVIDVNVSRIAGEFELGLAGSDAISAPSTTTRKAQTEVYVRNRESVVIGGMVLTGEQVNESKVPLLGDLPIIGWLFSSRETTEDKTEVFFVIRPILKDRPSINRFGDLFDPFDEAGSTE
ncbi:MAG: type II and III secretion system protein [Planctomycetes bacterium]|nr:type II and III secretion system protein [Planctomycetota bacterium]MCP4772348.1 type II and III secretion system protein [Planctomycetota bacterium]MCP4861552.1 type II and III secretion system protein [Planctomycetota bacterium]